MIRVTVFSLNRIKIYTLFNIFHCLSLSIMINLLIFNEYVKINYLKKKQVVYGSMVTLFGDEKESDEKNRSPKC